MFDILVPALIMIVFTLAYFVIGVKFLKKARRKE